MVKINFDQLKKMGSDLIDSAKSVNIGGVVDKIKSGVESVTTKKEAAPPTDDAIKNLFQNLRGSLQELSDNQNAQIKIARKIDSQLSELSRAVEALRKPATIDPATNSEDPKK